MSTWIVRISENNRNATRDWNEFVDESEHKRYVAWDKDFKNRITTGDTIGFIIGEIGTEIIYFYDVTGELSTKNRSSTWSAITYNPQCDFSHTTSKREVIVLDTDTITQCNFSMYKSMVGYKDSFIPMGTMRARPLPLAS